MKGQSVVELAAFFRACAGIGVLLAARSKADKVGHSLGSLITEELQVDVAVIGVQGCRLLCHVEAPFFS
jgi:hypothetical protein